MKIALALNDEDVKPGDHCWALANGELLVVMKDDEGTYQVCGAWECGIRLDELELLEIIPRPKGREETKLYYIE